MRTLILIVFLFLAPTWVEAQSAELALISQNTVGEDGDISPRLILEPYLYLTDKLGLWGYAYAEEEYGSATFGPFCDFSFHEGKGLFEVGVAAGVETYPEEESGPYKVFTRYASFASLDYGRLSLFSYYENGGSHSGWLRVFVDYHVTDSWALGVIHQTDDGVGPRITFTTSTKIPVRIWASTMFGDEPVVLVGIEVLFQKKK